MADPKDLEDDEEIKLPDEEEDESGLLDDEGGDEAEAGQESEDAEAEEGQVAAKEDRQPSRATRAVQSAKQEARAERERNAELAREIAALRAEREQRENAARQPRQESPEEEANRLALMTVDERVDYRLRKSEERHRQELNAMAFRQADASDKQAYAAKAAADPRYKRYEQEVENILQYERTHNNRDVPRETVLAVVIGRKVLGAGATTAKAKKAGQDRIKAQQSRADSGQSDRAAPRRGGSSGNSLRDLERKLENVQL